VHKVTTGTSAAVKKPAPKKPLHIAEATPPGKSVIGTRGASNKSNSKPAPIKTRNQGGAAVKAKSAREHSKTAASGPRKKVPPLDA